MNLSPKFFTADISSVINNLVLWNTLSQHFSGGNVKGSFSTWCTLNYYHSATSHGGDRWPLFNSNIYRSGYKSFLDDQGLPFQANLASKTETSVGPSLVNTRPSIPFLSFSGHAIQRWGTVRPVKLYQLLSSSLKTYYWVLFFSCLLVPWYGCGLGWSSSALILLLPMVSNSILTSGTMNTLFVFGSIVMVLQL